MPTLEVELETQVRESFRVKQVAGLFDVAIAEKSRLRVSGDVPGLDEAWTIGAIVGPSGSGKSTIARRAYGEGVVAEGALMQQFDWPRDAAVIDGFGDDLDGKAITNMLNAVGFSSPPAWVRPWHVLSNGEKFRADLARALLTDKPVIAFDEFTSVVDRQVARFGSAAVARAIRQNRAKCRRFVAVTCHYDVLEWLTPDWFLDMATGRLARGSLQRPAIELAIGRCGRGLWKLFRPHHYLSGNLNPVARCYAACWNNRPIGFCATIPMFGKTGRRIVHRLVVLPDYQGLGVGAALLEAVAAREAKSSVVSIVTSHPALIRSLARRKSTWRCGHIQKCGMPHRGLLERTGKRMGSIGRITASFRYLPVAHKSHAA
ncbi:MAG: GNAT family N-acetyltransferase [Phycisphaeraceae bacterium]|nr:GNAT family N-acetyltransferase [Phycisphaeraceae bacterium]